MNKLKLIDANKLKRDDLCDICKSADCSNCFTDEDFEQWINNQPIAYDINKSIRELKATSHIPVTDDEECWLLLQEAIEIVKGGAV